MVAQDRLGIDPGELGYSVNFPPSVAREVEPDEAYWDRVKENQATVDYIDANLVQDISRVVQEGVARSKDLNDNLENTLMARDREVRRVDNLKKAREAKANKDRTARANRELKEFNVEVDKEGDVKAADDGKAKEDKNSGRK